MTRRVAALFLIALGVALVPLPVPGGVVVAAAGARMLIRASAYARRRAVMVRRLHPIARRLLKAAG